MQNDVTLLTVSQFWKKHPFTSEGGLRHLLFSNKTFREECTRRLGRKILLIEEKVLEFIISGKGTSDKKVK